MHWHTRHWHTRGWLKAFALAGLLLLLASILTFDFYDPTITNLRYPSGGISNLAGLPGALVGGSLVEFLGTSSLWFPALLANWMLIPASRRNLGPYLLFAGSVVLFSATLHGLLTDGIMPAITAPGLVGIAGSRWMLRATEIGVAVPLLCAALVFTLVQLGRLPILGLALGPAFRDGRIISLYILRVALARCAGWWQACASRGRVTARRIWMGLGSLGLGRLRLGGLRSRGGRPGESMPSAGAGPGGGQAPQAPVTPLAATPAVAAGSPPPPLPRPLGTLGVRDEFNAWISALGEPTHGVDPADKP